MVKSKPHATEAAPVVGRPQSQESGVAGKERSGTVLSECERGASLGPPPIDRDVDHQFTDRGPRS